MVEISVSTERPIVIGRDPTLVTVQLRGIIDDQRSMEWRVSLTEELRLRGVPRFVAFDMLDADMRSSMASRFEVASYVRDMMKRVEWAALLLPRGVGSGVVVRVVMRLVSIAHVSAFPSRVDFQQALGEMRRGERPSR